MNTAFQEGAGRPLSVTVPNCPAGQQNPPFSSAPSGPHPAPESAGAPAPESTPAQPSAQVPKPGTPRYLPPEGRTPAWKPGPGFLPAALVLYLLAYFYTRMVLFAGSDTCRWSMPVFAVLYLEWSHLFARAAGRKSGRESGFWAVCWLVQSAAIALHGPHDALWLWQWMAWHAAAVYWTMARTGMLAAGRSSLWMPLDLLMGVTLLPWRDILLRLGTVAGGLWGLVQKSSHAARKQLLGWGFSILAALAVCLVAWNQLAGVDATFARLVQWMSGWLSWSGPDLDTVMLLILSLPVGAWLFGLAGGGLRRSGPPLPVTLLQRGLDTLPRLPVSAGYLVPGALCLVYALFFGLQAVEFFSALAGGTLSARAASDFAVTGFWELCRILMLNLAVLIVLQLLGGPLRKPGTRRRLLTVFGGFSLAFVLLAGGKLGAYIWLYGPTPLRIFSGWFVLVLGVWCLLVLAWLWRPVPAARIGVLVLAAGFALLCCLPVEQICAGENIRRYAAGQIEQVDLSLLRQCDNGTAQKEFLARSLLDARWFEGKTPEEIEELFWNNDFWQFDGEEYRTIRDGVGRAWLQDLPRTQIWLELTFRQGVCTGGTIRRGE